MKVKNRKIICKVTVNVAYLSCIMSINKTNDFLLYEIIVVGCSVQILARLHIIQPTPSGEYYTPISNSFKPLGSIVEKIYVLNFFLQSVHFLESEIGDSTSVFDPEKSQEFEAKHQSTATMYLAGRVSRQFARAEMSVAEGRVHSCVKGIRMENPRNS